MINIPTSEVPRYVKPKIRDRVINDLTNINEVIGFDKNRYDEYYINIESTKSKNRNECQYESHEKYVDIHIILEGIEIIETTSPVNLKKISPYDEMKDITFYQPLDDVWNTISICTPGTATIFYPYDAHRPLISYENVCRPIKKAIFKIKKEYLITGD